LEKVKEIESLSGQGFSDVIKPSISTYGDVQQATVARTLGKHEDVMIDQQQLAKEDIHRKAEQEREKIKDSTSANIRDGIGKAAIAGGIAASVDIVVSVYKKTKDGKALSSFTSDDWKEVGWSGAQKGTKGALTAGSLYVNQLNEHGSTNGWGGYYIYLWFFFFIYELSKWTYYFGRPCDG
ncbi:hypothetical protein ACT4UT_04760, partial [Bacillus sp. B-TM1]